MECFIRNFIYVYRSKKCITNHWREIFDPAAQIFLNSNVMYKDSNETDNYICNIPKPQLIDEELRDKLRSPRKYQNKVFERDGYKCRYCGIRLISQEFIKLFIKNLDSPIFQKGATNLSVHGIIINTWPVADHVFPWNMGGQTNLENLVSSCGSCNYGKDGYTCEQLGIEDPLLRKPILDKWDGLLSRINELKRV